MANLFTQKSLDVANYQQLSDADIINIQTNILARWQNTHTNSCGLENEIQHQHNFLQDFFGQILGYTAQTGNPHNTLWWESGTNDGRRPDGILGFDLQSYQNQDINQQNISAGDIRVVIELKGSNVDLDKNQNRKSLAITPIEQGFLYAPKVGGKCEWVIVSNFVEIRLYKTNDSNKYHSFFIADLAKDVNKLKEFHFLLAKNQLFTKNPNQSPTHSLNQSNQGAEIEKLFYAHYSALRYEIWQNLLQLNTEKHYGRNFYLYKAQKLIDRIIFIRFCKENSALNNDAVLEALNNKYIKGKYNRMKALFTAMNEGNPEIGIAKFNGGLFAPDADLDCLNVADEIIDKIVLLYRHNFGSDLDVNILGHIFEQSISDLENLTDNNEKQRKKDGVFYTPAYITSYIIQEAVGGWLNSKKAEIQATEGSTAWWQEYAKHLQSIKVLDPACGSGAFLVKVFDFLQSQWQEVKKHIKINYNYQDILLNNIYGVDINPASVGITKLSLWLKTAHHRQPLTTLDDNIKIGNSLIDDPNIAGYYSEFEGKIVSEVLQEKGDLFNQNQFKQDKQDIDSYFKKSLAFKWQEEFKQVFADGGFDVVVGNPPYGAELSEASQQYIKKNYNCGSTDTAAVFIYKANFLTKENANISFIIPKSYCYASNYEKLRQINQNQIYKLIDCGKVWNEVLLEQIIICLSKNYTEQYLSLKKDGENFCEISIINQQNCKLFGFFLNNINEKELNLAKKIKANCISLNDVSRNIPGDPIQKNTSENGEWNVIGGAEIDKFGIRSFKGKMKQKFVDGTNNSFIQDNSLLVQNIISHIQNPTDHIQITACIPQIKENCIIVNTINQIICNENVSNYYIWILLNNKLVNWYIYKFIFGGAIRTMHFYNPTTSRIPIPQIPLTEQQPFIEKAQVMLDLNQQLNNLSSKFIKLLSADLAVAKITKKLEKWFSLSNQEFFAEVGKQNKQLALNAKSQWLEYFETQKQQALALQNQINQTDNQIDTMVYALYGLNQEEISTIEEG